jgi:Spy/CpxP family protein refolding chaperone
MPDLTAEAKQQIETAYKTFEAKLKTIAHEHRTTVGDLLTQLDKEHVEALHKKLETEN